MESICCGEIHLHTSIFSEVTATPVALGSMMKCIFVQPFYQSDIPKNSTRDFSNKCKKIDTIKTSCRPPQPTTDRTIIFFHKKEGPFFFADRPPGSSYRPRRVESKGAACIPRQPITLRFVGYHTFLVGRAGEAQHQSRCNAVGAKRGKRGV